MNHSKCLFISHLVTFLLQERGFTKYNGAKIWFFGGKFNGRVEQAKVLGIRAYYDS